MILSSNVSINIFFILMRFYLANIVLFLKENKIKMDLNIEKKSIYLFSKLVIKFSSYIF